MFDITDITKIINSMYREDEVSVHRAFKFYTGANFVNRIPCFMRKYLRKKRQKVKHISKKKKKTVLS